VEITKSALTENPFMDMMINGFKKFEVGGRTFIGRQDPINVADFTASDNSTGLTVYDIETGEELLMNTNGAANSTGTPPFSPAVPNPSGIYDETHSVAVRIYDLDGNSELTGNFDVSYSNNTGVTNAHPLLTIDFDDLLGDGSNQSSVEQSNLDYDNSLDYMNLSQLAIQAAATMRANNGAEQSRLSFAADMLSINKINLESANSRIVDVDVAAESSQLARYNILQQAGTAMLAQANMSTQSILRLIS
jgi:flagellin-like hook-associated protein FlgL